MSWCGIWDYAPRSRSPDGQGEPRLPRTCIRPCCRLCRFSIKYGQDIVAFTNDGRQSPTLPFPVDIHKVRTPELRAAFQSCFGEVCTHDNKMGAACHAGCVALAECVGLTPAEYLPVFAYSYEPSKSDERRRLELLRFRLQQPLKKNLGRFPTEVWHLVAKDLVCEFATVTIPVIEPKTVFTIDALEAVWATYIEIDGVEYVKSVSNEHKQGGRLLWDKPKSPTGHVVYIAEDHLGVNEITNHPQVTQSAQSNQVSTWWRTITLKRSSTIHFKTDGVKIRSFSATTLLRDIKWSYPMTPDEIKGMYLYYTNLDREARMIPVEINAPDTIGYSFGWHYGCVYFHAHKRGESLDFYHELDARQVDECESAAKKQRERHEPHALQVAQVAQMAEESGIEWRYHPLNAGEAIEQVWIRQPRQLAGDDDDDFEMAYLWCEASKDMAIALVTNQSRVLQSGILSNIPQERFPWRCIAKSSTASPMRIFVSYNFDGINLFAAPKSGVPEGEPVHPGLYAEEPTNICLLGHDFHTSASLEDVAQVVPCKGTEQGKPRIHGLLLRYNDGHETTIGRFRLDCAQPPLYFKELSRLYLGIGFHESAPAEHVVDVRLSPPKDWGGLMWKMFSAEEPIQWSWKQSWSKVSTPSEGLAAARKSAGNN